ncbi:hypothetical protein BN946_scf184985.g76 [Trametes cinnabarina]|uniref:F-box domain-containing protein n=1 Tax=Pycnoporus cinnabarinus TaxID=5643 RepID=A0A060SDS5_PYCCI|nr:hypothetical protein BN946_scf184985.g76 [Trametes cinnabarina]
MSNQNLPLDLLLMILRICSPQTIAILMRTYRAVYEAAEGPRLLLRGGVSLSSSKELISFYKFMSAHNASNRFHHLRRLTISKGSFSPEANTALSDLFAHPLFRLESLTLHNAENIFAAAMDHAKQPESLFAEPPLLSALRKIRTLRRLAVDELDENAHALLLSLPPTLRSISLDMDSSSFLWSALGHPDDRNPIVLLVSQADTLETLEGSGFDLCSDHVVYDVVYPRVRRIRASYRSRSMPGTAAYAHAYPNVEHLALTRSPPCPAESIVADPYHMYEIRAIRAANRDDQVNYGSWRHLRVVEGSVTDVYMLGLVCRVPELRLRGDVTVHSCDLMEEVLCDVKPEIVSCTVVGGHLFEPDGVMSAMFARPEAQHLQALRMEVCLTPCEESSDIDRLVEDILQALMYLPLRKLALTVNYGLVLDARRRRFRPYSSDKFPAESRLESFDPEAIAASFQNNLSCLTEVTIKLSTESTAHEYLFHEAFLLDELGLASEAYEGSSSDFEEDREEVVAALGELGFGGAQDDDEGW